MIIKFSTSILCLVFIVNFTVDAAYDTRFDDINLDEVLSNDRLLKNYVKCLVYEGPCTPDGKELRETLPDAVLTDCSKCSEKQKYGADKVTHFLIDNRPEDWDRLEKMYDPQGNYRRGYLAMKTLDEVSNATIAMATTSSISE